MSASAKRSPVVVALLAASLVAACGSSPKPHKPAPGYSELIAPGTRPPQDDVERGVLARMKELSPGTQVTIAGVIVVAGTAYQSASGRECRAVSIGAPTANTRPPARLVCLVQGAWSFVPSAVSDWEPPEP